VSKKLFLSWQFDSPARVGRVFVRDALREAFEQLKLAATIEEPEREVARIDHDAGRVPAAADLVQGILKRIDGAEVFVADVTAVGRIGNGADIQPESAGTKVINSNVALELGYAARALADAKIVMVFNAHYGWQDELPFDVRNRADAIAYTLAPNAGRPEIEAERKRLSSRLATAIDRCLQVPDPTSDKSPATPSTYNKAVYFPAGEVLAQVGEAASASFYSYSTDTFCYLRLIPVPSLERPLAVSSLTEAARQAPILSRQPGGALSSANQFGAITFEVGSQPGRGSGRLAASTQLFKNGELWSLSATMVAHERGARPAWIKLPFLASVVFERVYYDTLRALLRFAQESLSLSPPWLVECGLVGIQGLHLGIAPEDIRGPVRQADVIVRRALKNQEDSAVDKLLLDFFGMLHEATGTQRPSSLHSFPPHRPR
jgi:hypothetical protein